MGIRGRRKECRLATGRRGASEASLAKYPAVLARLGVVPRLLPSSFPLSAQPQLHDLARSVQKALLRAVAPDLRCFLGRVEGSEV